MLLDWVAQYEEREDEFSFQKHLKILNEFSGRKIQITELKEPE